MGNTDSPVLLRSHSVFCSLPYAMIGFKASASFSFSASASARSLPSVV